MNCGFILADKWLAFKKMTKELRQQRGLSDKPFYMDGTSLPDTPERAVMDKLGIKKYCCRIPFMTHRDLDEKIH